MANEAYVELIKQGPVTWNAWASVYSINQLDLSGADLGGLDLRDINLERVNLSGAILSGAILHRANMYETNLYRANLSGAQMYEANLYRANLGGANLGKSYLNAANLIEANLSGADLSEAILSDTILIETNLSEADLNNAIVENITISKIDLHTAKGLATINYHGPSLIELHTIQLPQDGSALHFLRGVGVSDEWIEAYRVRMMSPIQYHSLFISYSTKDDLLARRLHADLQARGVRCWFAPEDLKIGDKFRQRIDEAIHRQDKLLLLLSKNSIKSTWVEQEVEAALEKEDRQKRLVLFPIHLDDAVMKTSQAWAASLRRMRHIGDFTNWTDPHAYKQAFDRLLRDLKH